MTSESQYLSEQRTAPQVAVIGAGSWGTTVASMLSERYSTIVWARESTVAESIASRHQNEVFLPDRPLSSTLVATTNLAGALAGRQLVLMAVPAQYLRSIAERAAEFISADSTILSLTKGIERQTLLTPSQLLREALSRSGCQHIGVLSGPNLAREVLDGEPSATVVAMGDDSEAKRLQLLLTSDDFRVYTSSDVIGCEIGGSVKNVIAIAVGIASGLGLGWNSRSALITRGLAELTRLGVAVGGDPLTFLGLAGNGDLIATCSSEQSRNRRVGVELGKGRPLGEILTDTHMVAEGVDSTDAILELARRLGVEMPVCEEVSAILQGSQVPQEVALSLMGRAPTTELHDLGRLLEGASGTVTTR
jgi:glycerol-3-phosphate dehydrogenase (NAD(P)+)